MYRYDALSPIEVTMPPGALYISQQFYRTADEELHKGIDIKGPKGTPVLAAASGRVVSSYYEPAYGNRIRIDHGTDARGRRVFTRYFHLDKRQRRVGEVVSRGEQIGLLGSTGALGLANHLHFEVHRGENEGDIMPVDPHLFWADGPGRVTCFAAARTFPGKFATTYPTPCK